MKRKFRYAFIIGMFGLQACTTQVDIRGIDKCELRSTARPEIVQLNFDVLMHFSKPRTKVGESIIRVSVDQKYLGTSVISAETSPVESQSYKLPLRITFPDSLLTLGHQIQIHLQGYWYINGKKQEIQYKMPQVAVSNLRNLKDY